MSEFRLEKYEIHRVFAVVIVNELFNFDFLPQRHGADSDRANIKKYCDRAGFHVDKFKNNLTRNEMNTLFKTTSEQDFSPYDAFVCFISSHGDCGGIYGVDGNLISVDEIVLPLKGKRSLVGKPKLFFTQNCRGRDVDAGVVPDRPSPPIYHPVEADILVAYSGSDGYEAYRDTTEGSWFITALTEVLNASPQDIHLADMLTIVNQRIAAKESTGRKQMPCFTSTLRKAVYLQSSRSQSSDLVNSSESNIL